MLIPLLVTALLTRAPSPHADRIVIAKSARQLTLLQKGKPLRTYHVSLGSNPHGAKEREGDGRTPEGLYTIDSRNAHSKYHLALHVSYPNAADRARAARLGVSPGGEIMVHGTPNRWRWVNFVCRFCSSGVESFPHLDWTAGCIAVSDSDIEEIWQLVPNGIVVEIRP